MDDQQQDVSRNAPEVNSDAPYYISAPYSPTEDRRQVLKHGKTFKVFDRYGDVEPYGLAEHGLFHQGTRYLSRFLLYLGNSRPLFLASTIKSDNSLFTADLANVDLRRSGYADVPRGTLHLVRSKFVWHGACYEQLKISNYGLQRVQVPLRIEFGADFADIFEVRGQVRAARGQGLPPEIDENGVVLGYLGLDQVRRLMRIQFSHPAEDYSDSHAQFLLDVMPRQDVTYRFTLACETGEAQQVAGFESAYSASLADLRAAQSNACTIQTANSQFNEWLERSLADVHTMILGNPEGDYPYAGIPWFNAVFGRDGIITAYQCLSVAPWIAEGVLRYLASTQADTLDRPNEAQPGKILHETRMGEMAALNEVPFRKYYGTIDATPLFIMLAGSYYERTGNRKFIESIWPNIVRALAWIDDYGDIDGDGFVEYENRSGRGLVQQGWKDSNDSVFHADGTLAEPPIALCEVQGYVYAAKLAAARLAAMLGESHRILQLQSEAAALQAKFESAFWIPELSIYAIALDGKKQPCRVRSSNAGHSLFTGIANAERAHLTARTLLGPDFFCGWGIRTIGISEARYNPISYHNGSVWPHDNSLIADGLARYGYKDLAATVLSAMLDVSTHEHLHRLPELFCGLDRRPGEGPTGYPVACAPQAWAAGAVFLLLQSCLGLTFDAPKKQIVLHQPYLPESLPRILIRDLKLGEGSVDLLLERQEHSARVHVLGKRGTVDVVLR